jgi:hypothetical protein
VSSSDRTIYVGTRPTVKLTFRDDDHELADPTAISIIVENPDLTTDDYATPDATISTTGTGEWEFTFPAALDEPGTYWVYFIGSGNDIDVASEVKIEVRGVHVPRP